MEENKKPENPNAFPSEYRISLRDYFAAKAMQALLSNRGNIEYIPNPIKDRDIVVSSLSMDAFDIADAMLKQREK